MNIAFISTGYHPHHWGGGSVSTQLIVDELRGRGLDVDVFTTTGSDKKIREIKQGYYEIPDGTDYKLPDRVGKNYGVFKYLFKKNKYDLIHAYGLGPVPAAVSRSSVPVLGTANSLEWVCVNWTEYLREGCPKCGLKDMIRLARRDGYTTLLPLKILMELTGKESSKQATHVTVQTEGMKKILSRSGYSEKKITTVPNLLDPRFDIKPKKDTNNFVYIGRLEEKKGIMDIVETYVALPDEVHSNWTFKIYGDGKCKSDIREIISRNDVDIKLEYCPYENLPNVYENASVMIQGSKYPEPFSRTWLEAMASETAIIASINPSSKAILSNCAELYDPFNKESLRRSLITVLTQKEKRDQLRKKGKESIEQYRANNVVDKYVKIYESLM